MVETERAAGAAYLTCNDRHHELILIEDRANRGYEHLALEVADAATLESAAAAADRPPAARCSAASTTASRASTARSRCSRPTATSTSSSAGWRPSTRPPPGDRPTSSSTSPARSATTSPRSASSPTGSASASPTAWASSRPGGTATTTTTASRSPSRRAPSSRTTPTRGSDFDALGRVADRLRAVRGRKCIWGPSRHGPGNNQFLYFHDEDGAMIECCSELAQMQRDGYEPKDWGRCTPGTINQWGGRRRSSSCSPASRSPRRSPAGRAGPSAADRTPATA